MNSMKLAKLNYKLRQKQFFVRLHSKGHLDLSRTECGKTKAI